MQTHKSFEIPRALVLQFSLVVGVGSASLRRIMLKARLPWIRINGFMMSASTVYFPTRGFSFKTGKFMAPREKRASNWKAYESTGRTAIPATELWTVGFSARPRAFHGAHDYLV